MKEIILIVLLVSLSCCGSENGNSSQKNGEINEKEESENSLKKTKHDTLKNQLLTPTEFMQYLSDNPGQILDVRTKDEFDAGYIDGAVNIDFYSDSFQSELENLDKKINVYVYCQGGGRSREAVPVLREMGFEHIYELDGGISAWLVNDLLLKNK